MAGVGGGRWVWEGGSRWRTTDGMLSLLIGRTTVLPQVSQLLQGDPRWPSLLDANDVIRMAWACRSLRHEDPPLMYLLQVQGVSQVGTGGGGGGPFRATVSGHNCREASRIT